MNIYSFGHKYFSPTVTENDLYVDVRELNKIKVGINKVGTDKATRRKYLNHMDIREYYENYIWYRVCEKKFHNVYIGCHEGRHKSVCLAEQLYIDAGKRFEVTLEHLTIDM